MEEILNNTYSLWGSMGTSQMLNNALMQHGPLPLHLTGQCRVIATYSLASFLLNELKCADFF